jgi:hypothetical protein
VLAGSVIAEGWVRQLPLVPAPAAIAIPVEATAVLELPVGNAVRDAVAMYRSLLHGRPVLNGWSGYAPPAYLRLAGGDVRVIREIAGRSGPVAVIVDPTFDGHERAFAMVGAVGGACTDAAPYVVCLVR